MDEQASASVQFMDLNNDCLLEIFKYLNLLDLADVASVCSRFQYLSRERFEVPRYKHLVFNYQPDVGRLKRISSVFRNFGAFISTIKLCRLDNQPWNARIEHKHVELLGRFSMDSLNAVTFDGLHLTDDMLRKTKTMLQRIRILKLVNCSYNEEFFKTLPPLMSELRELEVKNSSIRRCLPNDLHGNFAKLEKISFSRFQLDMPAFGEFLKLNAQLKELCLRRCLKLTDNIFQMVADCVPCIEKLDLDFTLSNDPSHFGNNEQLRRLKKLSCLTLITPGTNRFFAIDFTDIPIRFLELHYLKLKWRAKDFFDAISKSNKLQTLRLKSISDLKLSDVIEFCGNQMGLKVLDLHQCGSFSGAAFVEIIRRAEKLERLIYHWDQTVDEWSIGADAYTEMANIAKHRSHKTIFEIKNASIRYDDTRVPDDLIDVHKKYFELVVTHYYGSRSGAFEATHIVL